MKLLCKHCKWKFCGAWDLGRKHCLSKGSEILKRIDHILVYHQSGLLAGQLSNKGLQLANQSFNTSFLLVCKEQVIGFSELFGQIVVSLNNWPEPWTRSGRGIRTVSKGMREGWAHFPNSSCMTLDFANNLLTHHHPWLKHGPVRWTGFYVASILHR